MSPQLEQILALNHGEKPECESVDEPQCTLVLFQLADKNFAFYGAQIRDPRRTSYLVGTLLSADA